MKTKREVIQILLDVIRYNKVLAMDIKDYVFVYSRAFEVDITIEEIERLLILQ